MFKRAEEDFQIRVKYFEESKQAQLPFSEAL